MSESTASPDTSEQPSFEEDLERLNEIVGMLDEEPESLAQALDLYEEGVTIAQRCMEQLEKADLRVQELTLDPEDSADSS